ncbi:MAG TPA: Fe-S cluster assembly protein SufD, partial [Rhodanobacteraceae bacterium]|nr:Fe-S cluster assembly protein SufD [Rhodanobacteraceae bacterium]
MNAVASPFVESMQAAAAARLSGSGPAWLDDARHQALRAFIELGLPDNRNELWKYTALRALQQRAYAARDDEAANRAVADDLLRLEGCEGPRAVFVNGVFRADLSWLEELAEGITLQPLSDALEHQPEPLRFLLAARGDEDDGFTLLNRALAADGLIVRVADGARVPQPLHIVHVGTNAGSAIAWHLRDLIELGEGASLAVVEHHVGDDTSGHLANIARTITLRAHARFDWTVVQRASSEATLLRRTDCVLHEDAALDFHALELGGKLARHELRADLAGDRARFASRGAFVLDGRRHGDSEVLVTHRGRDTVSDSLWRGVAGDRARGVVHGRILVQPGADGSDGSFYNKNLLLSPTAEIDTRPALEIYADEVKANHGATVGQLDDNVLFYLRSR